MKDTLFLITARGGSKGIPGKNIKKLNGLPLLYYSIDIARQFVSDEQICLSTDDKKIIRSAAAHGLIAPFVRPAELATDTAGSGEVVLHALEWYNKQGISYNKVVLLQPTSPLRLKKHVGEALKLFSSGIDMVVSATLLTSNPYATLYRKSEAGFIEKIFGKTNGGVRRQDAPPVYKLNGAVYVINANSLRKKGMAGFDRIKMITMPALNSVDIDLPEDWYWCEFILKEKMVKLDYRLKAF